MLDSPRQGRLQILRAYLRQRWSRYQGEALHPTVLVDPWRQALYPTVVVISPVLVPAMIHLH